MAITPCKCFWLQVPRVCFITGARKSFWGSKWLLTEAKIIEKNELSWTRVHPALSNFQIVGGDVGWATSALEQRWGEMCLVPGKVMQPFLSSRHVHHGETARFLQPRAHPAPTLIIIAIMSPLVIAGGMMQLLYLGAAWLPFLIFPLYLSLNRFS